MTARISVTFGTPRYRTFGTKASAPRLYARLQVQGLPIQEIKAEIDRFAIAVQAEMQRAAWAEWRRNHGGDAA